MKPNNQTSLSYSDAGVDIAEGQKLVENIKPIAKKTLRPEVLTGLGGFGALFEIDTSRYRNPVLVSGTDGVGTKLKLAIELNRHDTIGIDLVAMCVNDLIVCGAEPLFFLDYFATGHLSAAHGTEIISGIGRGCELAGAALIGGETAEMPGMYAKNDYDLAGFCVGVVEKDAIISSDKVQSGDVLVGLASSGPHSNGYSLIRKVLEHSNTRLDDTLEGKAIGDILLEPTRIYVKSVLHAVSQHDIHAIAHITGGGIIENLPRVLPDDLQANIHVSWPQAAIFDWLQTQGNIKREEMYRTFNMGIGMILCTPEKEAEALLKTLEAAGETAWIIGHVANKPADQAAVVIV